MRERRLRNVTWITLILIYLVVIAGGVVRMTGAGMGCPDWPTCFGKVIPPTNESELPENYRIEHAEKNKEKVEKFAGILRFIGLEETANRVLTQSARDQEEEFNAAKTYTEWINRLFGFLAGNVMLLQVILAFLWFRKTRRNLLWLSILNLIIIVFQAWLGSIVVATNLVPGVITIHFIFALLIVMLQLIIISNLTENKTVFQRSTMFFKLLLGAAVIATTYQIFAGTQVRQMVDVTSHNNVFSDSSFLFHRSFAWVVLALNLTLIYILLRKRILVQLLYVMLGVLVLEVLVGIILYKLDIPQWAQPVHLTLGVILFGLQVWLLLRLFNNTKTLEGAALG